MNLKKITWSAPHVVTKAASRNSDHTFDNCLTDPFFFFTFFFFFLTEHCTDTLFWERKGLPIYTFQMTSLLTTLYSPSCHDDQLQHRLQC